VLTLSHNLNAQTHACSLSSYATAHKARTPLHAYAHNARHCLNITARLRTTHCLTGARTCASGGWNVSSISPRARIFCLLLSLIIACRMAFSFQRSATSPAHRAYIMAALAHILTPCAARAHSYQRIKRRHRGDIKRIKQRTTATQHQARDAIVNAAAWHAHAPSRGACRIKSVTDDGAASSVAYRGVAST